MTTHTLRRWGAVLLTGGLFMTAAYLIFPSSAHSSLTRPAASLALVGVLLSLPGLVAYQRGQPLRAGVNGWVGTVITVLALTLLEIPHLVLGVFSPSSLYDLDSYHAGVWGQLEFTGLGLLPIGLVVLAVATWRSATYPRWAVWALVANIAVGAAGGSVPAVSDAIRMPAPNYLLMGLLGLAMIRLTQKRGTGPEATMVSGRRDPATTATR